MGARNKHLVNSNSSVDRLHDMSSKLSLTLPGATPVKLLSKKSREQLVGTYVPVSALRNCGMIVLKDVLI